MSYAEELAAAWADHLAPRKPDAYTVVSTFAGAGGSSLGYSMAGFNEVGAVEWDDHAAYVFGLNLPDVQLHHGDISTVDTAWRPWGEGELDVLDGSPPCQGFSMSGRRQLGDERNDLFRQYVRLLDAWRPRAFVMENVSGLVRGKMRAKFVEILGALKGAGDGYRVAVQLVDASWFRVPQSRQRLIFVGLRADLRAEPKLPPPQSRPLTVRDAWRDLRALGEYATASPTHKLAALVPRIAPGQSGADVLRAAGRKPSWHGISRLRFDAPATTIIKSFSPGAATGMLHPSEDRFISIGELKRLQSFPDEYDFGRSTYIEAHARIGNSVPPFLMRAIATCLRGQLDRLDGRDRHG